MNLRNVTIWTTGLLPVITLVALVVLTLCDSAKEHKKLETEVYAFIAFGVWLCCGSPLLFLSFFIARKLKYNRSIAVLLASTIVYVILFALVLLYVECFMVFPTSSFYAIVSLLVIVKAPAWIATYVLNRRYTRKQEPQV